MSMKYEEIFHALYPLRTELRRRTVYIFGTRPSEKLIVVALRALGVQIGSVIEVVSPHPEIFMGLPVTDINHLYGLEHKAILMVCNHPLADSTIELLSAQTSGSVYLEILNIGSMKVEVPAQKLAPLPNKYHDRKKLDRFLERRKCQRSRRYTVAQSVFRWLFTLYFMFCRTGWQYGISRFDKIRLAYRAYWKKRYFKNLSTPVQLLWLCHELYKVSILRRGDVAECGCYDGYSTSILSLACRLVGRKLYVCDSFEGLPDPDPKETMTVRSGSAFYQWKRGEFASPGGLEGVKEKVSRYGAIESCVFIPGFFSDSLVDLPADSLVLVFEDADLTSSVKDCIRYLWPRLRFGCKFFSHEPWSIDVVSIFFDRLFWQNTFGCPPPGFYGGDMGGIRSQLLYFKIGYALKRDFEKIIKKGKRVMISGSL